MSSVTTRVSLAATVNMRNGSASRITVTVSAPATTRRRRERSLSSFEAPFVGDVPDGKFEGEPDGDPGEDDASASFHKVVPSCSYGQIMPTQTPSAGAEVLARRARRFSASNSGAGVAMAD